VLAALSTLAALAAGCSRREVESCRDPLNGSWRADPDVPVASAAHWAIVDHGVRLDIYPLFDDTRIAGAQPDVVVSPRSLALIRSHNSLIGHVERWIMRGGRRCQQRAPARISGCRGRAPDIELPEFGLPSDLALCLTSPVTPHRQRWHRDD
jgi:hypothetical protein